MNKVLTDQLDRQARDLRISVTDRCNLRCTYCMPEEGLDWIDRQDILSTAELQLLASIFVDCGIDTVRLTGGEPLVRADIVDIVSRIAALGVSDLSLTTNAVRLGKLAQPMADAGLNRVNISLDSLIDERYALMTRRNTLPKVFEGIKAAVAAGLDPIKINCVAIKGVNEDEIVDFARFAHDHQCQVRFIEPMPLDGDRAWDPSVVIPGHEIVDRINAVYPLAAMPVDSSPATEYRFTNQSKGSIGVIASVTAPFCKRCDRLRLTADGQLRTCLFAHEETDLRTPLRQGATEAELADIIGKAVWNKQAGHGIGNVNFSPPRRTMSSIGG